MENASLVVVFLSFFEHLRERDTKVHGRFTRLIAGKEGLIEKLADYLVVDAKLLTPVLIELDRSLKSGLSEEDLRKVGQNAAASEFPFCIRVDYPDGRTTRFGNMDAEFFVEWFYNEVVSARTMAS